MTRLIKGFLTLLLVVGASLALAQGNLEINTPTIAALKSSMQARHAQLAPFYASGAIGLAANGTLAVRDAKAAPLSQRAKLNALVSAENADRMKLYKEIAQANGHPEWAAQVQKTFAQRWIDKAPGGWYVQRGGEWTQK
ncbi:YdbL family protein [Nitrogeniibacter mangrovi]|uniref:YdbL family protein n=1 Tax=Nitrogeniibacter mangrovi TaxID=2016596 RepID=A0A6C1B537_9RHOO|nr:YdbL family protein [Nitrogeniibacter mangrovi]QID17400.1 YdbL family protein [Nitrogeniibacter mangrovi]